MSNEWAQGMFDEQNTKDMEFSASAAGSKSAAWS